jgi:hypothetical protein
MGAWGTLPDQNDDAQDLYEELVREPTNEAVRQMLLVADTDDGWDLWPRIGVVYHLAVRDIRLDDDILEHALQLVDLAAADQEWMRSWKDAFELGKSVRIVQLTLQTVLEGGASPTGLVHNPGFRRRR